MDLGLVIFLFEVYFVKHTVFQHKIANLYHVSQTFWSCRSPGLQPQAAPQEQVHLLAHLQLFHSPFLRLFYVA